MDYSVLMKTAIKAVDKSGDIVRKYFRSEIGVDDKADESPVTIADKQTEQTIRQIIEKDFPDHGIIGEEFGKKNENAEFVWVIDPIDGTKSFITGSPLFGTLVAVLHNETPVIGIIDQPITKERWTGKKGFKSTLNSQEIKSRDCKNVEEAYLFAAGPEMFNGRDSDAFKRLSDKSKLTRFSADCYAYGLLAAGHIDIVCEAQMNLYDFAALVPVVEGAGGIITDWQGQPLNRKSDGRVLACGNKELHKKAIEILAG